MQERSPEHFAGRHWLCEQGPLSGQAPKEQETNLEGRALRALMALPPGWVVSYQIPCSISSGLAQGGVWKLHPILALETLAPSPSSAFYKTLDVSACLLSCKMGMA